jgi:hypothetical protein
MASPPELTTFNNHPVTSGVKEDMKEQLPAPTNMLDSAATLLNPPYWFDHSVAPRRHRVKSPKSH